MLLALLSLFVKESMGIAVIMVVVGLDEGVVEECGKAVL